MKNRDLIPRRRVLGLGVALAGLCRAASLEYREHCRRTGSVWGESNGRGGKGSAGRYQ